MVQDFHGKTVDVDHAGAALAGITADVCPGQSQTVAEELDQKVRGSISRFTALPFTVIITVCISLPIAVEPTTGISRYGSALIAREFGTDRKGSSSCSRATRYRNDANARRHQGAEQLGHIREASSRCLATERSRPHTYVRMDSLLVGTRRGMNVGDFVDQKADPFADQWVPNAQDRRSHSHAFPHFGDIARRKRAIVEERGDRSLQHIRDAQQSRSGNAVPPGLVLLNLLETDLNRGSKRRLVHAEPDTRSPDPGTQAPDRTHANESFCRGMGSNRAEESSTDATGDDIRRRFCSPD